MEIASLFVNAAYQRHHGVAVCPLLCWQLSPHLSRVVSVEITGCSRFANRYREEFKRPVNMRTTWRGLP